jgi:hypothetical protein
VSSWLWIAVQAVVAEVEVEEVVEVVALQSPESVSSWWSIA